MTKTILYVTTNIFISCLLIGCGGGGGSNNFDGNTNVAYEGEWGGVCEYDADFLEADLYTLNIDGAKATIDFETFPTSDCSGSASDTGQIVYALDFVGTQNPSTGVCAVDDLVNTKIVSAKANGTSLNSAQLNIIQNSAIQEGGFPEFILLCVNPAGDTLYAFDENSGDGKTEATRPNQIDVTEAIFKSNSF